MAGIPDSKIKGLAKADADAIVKNATRLGTFDLIKTMNKKQLDQLMKKNKLKASQGLKSGGRAGLRGGGISKRGLGRAFMKGGRV